jgi:L-glyceraldehyde 3-phosphate reductase
MNTPSPTRYDSMVYNRCGRSGLKLPAVSLGLWHNFGSAMLWRAFDLGITHFDLANNYGPIPGSAEENFGRILASGLGAYRDELILSTKAGYRMWPGPYGDWGSRKYLLASLDQSLRRMGIDYVDIFYSHRPDPETPIEETVGALVQAVRQGKALYVGISSYNPDQTRAASALLREAGVPCLIHQPCYNLFNRWVEDGLLDVLGEEGIGMISFCPLAQGLLTGRYLDGNIPDDSRAGREGTALSRNSVDDAYLAKARKLDEIARRRGQTLAQMALAWNLRDPRSTSVLIGASRVCQIEENVAALQCLSFDPSELAEIDAVLEA